MSKFFFFILLSSLTLASHADTFSFKNNEAKKWSFYGEGLGDYVSDVGYNDSNSLWLSSDWGEQKTAFYQWDKLTAGRYRVSFYVRAFNVQEGPEGYSFWHFYDGGSGTVSPFYDLNGSYDWRKVEYDLEVNSSSLTIWFRLKTAGQIWVDDFSLQKTSSPKIELSIADAKPFKTRNPLVKEKSTLSSLAKDKTIYSFETTEQGHPFAVTSFEKSKVGKLISQKFYNFEVNKTLNGNWSDYDRLSMDVYNPSSTFQDIYVTLTDKDSSNYWTQLNHKSHLGPGWNKLNFSLKQFVGERGSHRFQRSLDLTKLQKFFLIIDPNNKASSSIAGFYIDNIKLLNNSFPTPPSGVQAFDFTSHKAMGRPGFSKVTTQHLYDENMRYGFVNPTFWRVEDSQYANETLRYSIGLLKGRFRVKVPNGQYRINLVIDKLGYWDTSFWSSRTVYINGKPTFKEARSKGSDYIADLLQFEGIEPSSSDHPFDLYLTKLFKPVEKTIEVANGYLDFEFEGDPSGISLNRLFFWEASKDKAAKKYLKEIYESDKKELDWLSRPLASIKASEPVQGTSVKIINPDLLLRPDEVRQSSAQEISLFGGKGERPYAVIQLASSSNGTVNWKISALSSPTGDVISGQKLKTSLIINQFTSPDLNHETYILAGKYLKDLERPEITLKGNESQYLWIEFPIDSRFKPETYRGEIVFDGKDKRSIPIELKILPYELPKVDFPVGFFGIDPIPFTYFTGSGLEQLRRAYRKEALKELAEGGFTTFTGLPEVSASLEGNILNFNTSSLDQLLKDAKELGFDQPVFSYAGQFPKTLLNEEFSHKDYLSRLNDLFSKYSKNGSPKIIHTFSDEAGGYSNRVAEDLEIGKNLKKKFPNLLLGGFSSFGHNDAKELNQLFDYGFFSNYSQSESSVLSRKGKKWGNYNFAPGNLDDPRFSFGPGLFIARSSGLSHYLEWHATGFNNYPYYELDGRESDVSMFLPNSNGSLYKTLKYKFSVEGLELFRKLVLLDSLIKSKSGSKDMSKPHSWFRKLRTWNSASDLKVFKKELNAHLEYALK